MLLAVLLMLASLPSFAQDNNSVNNGLYELILDHPSCIAGIQENRIYFQADQIYPTENGLFLQLDQGRDFVQLQHLFSDRFGCYIHLPKERVEQVKEILNRCPHCGEKYYAYCKNPECPSNKKRK